MSEAEEARAREEAVQAAYDAQECECGEFHPADLIEALARAGWRVERAPA